MLQAAIAATQDERRFDAAILRTLGASQRQLAAAQIAEFLLLGALAGLVAGMGAVPIGWALADRVVKIPFEINRMVLADGVLAYVVGTGLVRRFYRRHELWVTRASGLLFIGFGLNALWHSTHSLWSSWRRG